MLASFIIVFREVIEAGLIAGVVLAASRGMNNHIRYVVGGACAGALGACLLAWCAGSISDKFHGSGQEVFNAAILFAAVIMLAWHHIWMARHGRELQQAASGIGRSVAANEKPMLALSLVVALAVLREGAEVVLFLYGIAISGHESTVTIASGAAIGLLGGAAVCVVSYQGLARIPVRSLFRVTGWMLLLLASGLAAQGISYLTAGGFITTGERVVWDTSAILADSTIIGRSLHALFGYTDRPTEAQLAVYILTGVGILGLAHLTNRPRRKMDKPIAEARPASAR